MKPNASIAEHDASRFVEVRAKQPSAAEFIVENHERLPFVTRAEPLLDRLISRASAVLRRIPRVMQDFSNHAEASALKQRDEPVAIHQPQPARRYDDVRSVFLNDAQKRLGCRRMPESLQQVDWALSLWPA